MVTLFETWWFTASVRKRGITAFYIWWQRRDLGLLGSFLTLQAERRCMTTHSGRSFRAGEMAENALQEMLLKLIEDRQK